MNRKAFLRHSLLTGAAAALLPKKLRGNTVNEGSSIESIGYNHLPNKEEQTMHTVLHRANTRGHANHGWLDTHHTFSFANYHNPQRMNFGVLRVLNDDSVAAGKGFGTHPHDNMEIISIPLSGDLEHKDSMGNTAVIKSGDVQVMSAGTGVFHSEYNKNADQAVKFLQIWVYPNQKNVEPRYDQISLDQKQLSNQLYQVLSPNSDDEGVWIHQNAWFYMGNFKKGQNFTYHIKDKSNGIYTFVLEGNLKVNGQDLNTRDGYGVWQTGSLNVEILNDTKILVMEVPMTL